MMSRQDAEKLARLVASARPGWDFVGVMAALQKVHDRELIDVARAALNAAADPTNRTPAVIALAGAHWATTTEGAKTPLPPRPNERCPTHLGWGRNCPGCRADTIAGDAA